MKTNPFTPVLAAFAAIVLFAAGCNAPAETEEATSEQAATKPDRTALKAEIQALETQWAKATTDKDVPTLMSYYAEDAIEMPDDLPMQVGKVAIEAGLRESMKTSLAGRTVAYETMDVYGDENTVTEVGRTTIKDATGKVVSTGKYVGIFEKRDGKWLCIRDINNEDQKPK